MSAFSRDKALDKIRKLLRLSGSANANEAAIALRQAQVLMAKFAVDAAEVDGADPIIERGVERKGVKNPSPYSVALRAVIAAAFGLRSFSAQSAEFAGWKLRWKLTSMFVGPAAQVEMACYAYIVLLRQLERDRRAHLSRVRKAANRAARGNAFGLAWVAAVSSIVGRYAGDIDPRIEGYLAAHHPDLTTSEVKARTAKGQDKLACNDHHAGRQAGRRAQLARGVNGSSQRLLEAPR